MRHDIELPLGPPRRIPVPIRVEPRSARHGLIGSAFDYLMRFEIARRVPVVEDRWIADHVADGRCELTLSKMKDQLRKFCESRTDFRADEFADDWEESRPVRTGRASCQIVFDDPHDIYFIRLVRKVVVEARSDIAAYRAIARPSIGEQKQAAFQAVRLAKIDVVFRAGLLDPTFEDAERDDLTELVELLGIVPWEQLLQGDCPILNPVFGCKELGIGADGDLLCGDCLIEIKTTKLNSVEPEWLDQQLGYFILARYHHRRDEREPEVTRLGLYLARHGYLWLRDASEWTDRPGFAEFEKWFLDQMPGRHLSPE